MSSTAYSLITLVVLGFEANAAAQEESTITFSATPMGEQGR
jgi:hypothetical protein